jgi:hypothetical protein
VFGANTGASAREGSRLRRLERELNEVLGGFGLLRLRDPHTAPAVPSPSLCGQARRAHRQ